MWTRCITSVPSTLLAAQNVEIEMVLQTRSREHSAEVIERLRAAGLDVRQGQ